MTTERLISTLLRAGVLVSILTVTAGTTLTFWHHPEYRSSPRALSHLTRPGSAFETIGEVTSAIRSGSGQGIVMLGVLLLISTPVLRVALSIGIFAKERDTRFVVATSLVLLLLLVSFLVGRAGE